MHNRVALDRVERLKAVLVIEVSEGENPGGNDPSSAVPFHFVKAARFHDEPF